MPYQNANSGGSSLAIIWLVAMIILLLLFVAIVIFRSGGKIKNEAMAEQVSLFSQDKPRRACTTRQQGCWHHSRLDVALGRLPLTFGLLAVLSLIR